MPIFKIDAAASSPRSWGCFYSIPYFLRLSFVFPTLVGVFPGPLQRPVCQARLPHARGGVSSLDLEAVVGAQVFPTLVGVFL